MALEAGMTVRGAGLRVLVVENEPLLRAFVEELVVRLGHGVAGCASSAQRAIEEAGRTCPDVVFMDIELDGPEDGIYAAREIRDRLGIPSLFMTGRTDLGTRKRALSAHPLAYLLKPVSSTQLAEALCRVSANRGFNGTAHAVARPRAEVRP
jgi:two-component system, response regulator PdtaR